MLKISKWAAVAALCLAAGSASAQEWPEEPITWILPAGPGGNSDILARILGNAIEERLGQPVIMDHRPGAAGRIAAQTAAAAEPDGYTFFMTSSAPHGVVPALYDELSYDPVEDFEPVAMLVTTPNLLYVGNHVEAETLEELIAYAKENPGLLNFGSAGLGTTMHMSAVLFALKAGIEVVHVPYTGGAEVLTGAMGGSVDAAFESLPVAKPQVEGGNIRALAITDGERSDEMPDVPTMAEQGLTDVEVVGWYGILAPKGTPQPIVEELSTVISEVLADPAVAERLRSDLGAEPNYLPPAEFQDFYTQEIARWEEVVEEAGIVVE